MHLDYGMGLLHLNPMKKPIPQYLLASTQRRHVHRRESTVIFVVGCAVGVFLVLILHSILNF
jgi:hypothetical protein